MRPKRLTAYGVLPSGAPQTDEVLAQARGYSRIFVLRQCASTTFASWILRLSGSDVHTTRKRSARSPSTGCSKASQSSHLYGMAVFNWLLCFGPFGVLVPDFDGGSPNDGAGPEFFPCGSFVTERRRCSASSQIATSRSAGLPDWTHRSLAHCSISSRSGAHVVSAALAAGMCASLMKRGTVGWRWDQRRPKSAVPNNGRSGAADAGVRWETTTTTTRRCV